MTAHITHTEIVSVIDIFGYQSILEYFDKLPSDAKKIIDHYFDDEEKILSKNNIILRKRDGEKSQIDIKIPGTKKPGEMIDLKEKTNDSFLQFFSEEIQETIKNFGIKKIYYVGYIPIKRISIPHASVEGKWIIDHLTFPLGKDEYRIELKHSERFCDDALSIFTKLLQEVHLEPIKPPSKFKTLTECLLHDEKIKKELKEGAQRALKA